MRLGSLFTGSTEHGGVYIGTYKGLRGVALYPRHLLDIFLYISQKNLKNNWYRDVSDFINMNALTIGFPAKIQIHARFAMNLIEALDGLKAKSGYRVIIKYLLGKSNLSHARSVMLTEWYDLAKSGDLFMFIDADHSFYDEDILRVINQRGDLRAGVYANRAGLHTSMPVGGTFQSAENCPLLFAATGFLCITYEACQQIHNYMQTTEGLDRVTISDGVPVEDACIPFFHPLIEPLSNNGKRYWLGEDFSFSLRARKANLTIVGAVIHTLGHEIPYLTFFNKPLRPRQTWSAKSIVYYCGNSKVRFGPNDQALGGSEQAVVHLAAEFQKRNYNVYVYGNVEPCTHNGVSYLRHEEFNTDDTFGTLILWRRYGLEVLLHIQNANKILVDLHDPTDPIHLPSELISKKVKYVMVKSQYHMSLYQYLQSNQFKIIPNGIQREHIASISQLNQIKRIKTRFCYTSSYDRGLVPILTYMWPLIKQHIADAELHIHYGSNLLPAPIKATLEPLLKQSGVYEHSRGSYTDTIISRLKSFAQLYVSSSPLEIDCLSIKEAAYTGCIPILSTKAVFPERAGIHVEGDPDAKTTLEKAALTVISLVQMQDEKLELLTSALKKSAQVLNWSETANIWCQAIEN